uniref:mannose-6-phosphate isomerase n=1 Tax=Meloidogyne incognita TaxID=6306 RepID=A0A914MHL0_MELIC
MQRLECTIQKYKWGKKGLDGLVAQLSGLIKVEEDESYAELWMGTHKNGPSKIKNEGILLSEYFEKNPKVLGEHEKKGLNFLFKVLSVGSSLSVQSHPTKEQAIYLHSKDPKNYPDANHKPELAIALTEFELLCGFRKPEEILSNIKLNKEIEEIIGEEEIKKFSIKNEEENKNSLKIIFTKIWTAPEEKIKLILNKILERISKKEEKTNIDNLIIRLNNQFPEDIGIIAPLFLNYFTLKPGEATFLGPNEPHAYLFGDCVECMALSDNTIRAGLTPKFKDVQTLCENLTYKMSGPPIFESKKLANGIVEYSPPVEEFVVHKLDQNVSILQSIQAASIIIIISGKAILILEKENLKEEIIKGDILFIPQLFEAKIEEKSEDFLAFRAFTPQFK